VSKDTDGNTFAYNGKRWIGWDSAENVRRKVMTQHFLRKCVSTGSLSFRFKAWVFIKRLFCLFLKLLRIDLGYCLTTAV